MTRIAHTTFIASALATLLSLASPAQAANISAADYSAGKARLDVDHKADKAACGAMTANAKDVCLEEAHAKEKNGRAALAFSHTGKASDQKKLLNTQLDTAYDVAKEKCDDQAGTARDVCVQQAKATRTKGEANLKLVKDASAASQDAADTKRDADHKVADEKCEALAGDAKAKCLSAAQARFGKT